MRLKLYYLVIFFICLLSCNKGTDCDCNRVVAPDIYKYPVLPGTDAWNAAGAAGRLDSLYKLCQVPQQTLQNMSTAGLLESICSNPCLANIMLRDDFFQGRDEVLPRLNVSTEFNKRSDAAQHILSYYAERNLCCAAGLASDFEKGKFSADIALFDIICTQDSLLNQLNDNDKKKFAQIVLEKYDTQLSYPTIFGLTKITAMILLSQIMIRASFQPYLNAIQNSIDLKVFVANTNATKSTLNIVLEFGKQYAN